MQKYEKGFLVAVIAAALLAAAFIHPRLLGNKWRPWRLGLDLLGGSHLVYRVDLSKVAPADQESVVNGLRDVIEKRVNLFGVSEPQVFVARSAGETRLVVELAGVRDVHKAIQEIGETPFLEFREVQEQQGEGTSTEPAFIPTKLTGRYITGAQLSFDTTGAPQVSLTLNS
ncbi:protein translocase subunit SecD, partial [Candidatus Parcubacteria bacterium]